MNNKVKKLALHQETLRKLTPDETSSKAAVPFSVLVTFCIVCPQTVTNCFPCINER